MLFSVACVLSWVESIIGGALALPPGVKLGLSNIVVVFAMLCLGGREATALAVLKALFVLLTRGAVASLLSLTGGMLSVAVLFIISRSTRISVSYAFLCVAGSLAHNIGQIAAAALLLQNSFLVWYLPVLLFTGIATGLLTGAVYRSAAPSLLRLAHYDSDDSPLDRAS